MVVTPTNPTTTPDQADESVAYAYGWRYVTRVAPNGLSIVEQVPLTLEDVLHPQEGDQVLESEPHERRRRYLADVLTARLADEPGAVVLSRVQIAWDGEMRPHAPDISVILGVRERQAWRSFDVTAEGVRPALIIELTSPNAAELDRSRKYEHYEQVGVAQYVIVDAVRGNRQVTPHLLGYLLGPDGYVAQAADERGRLWLEASRLWLGVEGDEIVCHDEADRALGDYKTLRAALASAEAALAGAEAALAGLEAARTAAEAARTAAEQAAAAERDARLALEARLREVEQELRRQRG